MSVISKVMERIVNKALLTHCLTNGLLLHLQFGFLPKRSTNDALLLITQQIQDNLDKGFESRLISLNLSAAFEYGIQDFLLHVNCRIVGPINGHLLRWIKSYLSNRFMLEINSHFWCPPGQCTRSFSLLKILKIESSAMQTIVPFSRWEFPLRTL